MLYNILQDFFVWDTLLHTISGFIFAFLGYKLLLKLISKKTINKIIIIVFSISFSMTIAVLWEFIEFSSDVFFSTDMQKDRIVENISSVKINKIDNKPVIINNIDHTILYDKFNNKLLVIDGYLDIGIIDTMKDLFVNLMGIIVFLTIILLKKIVIITKLLYYFHKY